MMLLTVAVPLVTVSGSACESVVSEQTKSVARKNLASVRTVFS